MQPKGRADGRTDMNPNSRFSQFCERAYKFTLQFFAGSSICVYIFKQTLKITSHEEGTADLRV
jgi:hypothetical protein